MTTIVEQLSAYATALRYEDLPSEVVKQAKRLIVDSVGCALGGYASEPGRIAREMAATITSTRPATVLFTGQQTSPDGTRSGHTRTIVIGAAVAVVAIAVVLLLVYGGGGSSTGY